jgi:hypothetical protein
VCLKNSADSESATGSKTKTPSGQKRQNDSATSNKSLGQKNIKAPRNRKYSKDDLRKSSPDGNSASKSIVKKNNKYSKSVAEYVSKL